VAVALAVLLPASVLAADEPQKSESPDKPQMSLANIPTWTLGGKQFWTDELIHGEWRIQRNVLSGHYRLLDSANIRRAWGSWDACLHKWNALKEDQKIEPLHKKVIVVLHGLGRTRSSMKSMVRYLAENGDYSVLSFSYASTRSSLAADAKSLQNVLNHLEGVEEINFVAHSMGNLVVRHLLGDQMAAARGLGVDHRIGRIVMLAPPNNGAALARRLKNNPVFRLVFATGGREFSQNWDALQEHLITPPCQFGIIAGGAEDGAGRNPLLEGNDDLVVTVQETRLPGAHDFVVVPFTHTFIMDNDKVQQYTLRFLQQGYFISEDRRQPIEKQ
jgi:pimeloyl-ACP methyl ester carboxylesterase